ncbi:MAG: HNH endonuclease, partial [DPANN group archaeon]|nr:HNH endonuclease [DPANN group archaeon]
MSNKKSNKCSDCGKLCWTKRCRDCWKRNPDKFERTEEHNRKISEAHKGKPKSWIQGSKHYNWKGGDTRWRGGGWESIHQQTKERDNYTCQKCGRTRNEIKICVHHIKRWQDGGATIPENLITICQSCHNKEHKFGNQRFIHNCKICGREYNSGSAMQGICKEPKCRTAYNTAKHYRW